MSDTRSLNDQRIIVVYRNKYQNKPNHPAFGIQWPIAICLVTLRVIDWV